jgi:cobalt-zinc-cadmium resistance protein CzcA
VHLVSQTFIEGMGLVLLVLILFLGSARAAFIVAITVPFSLLFAFICMRFTHIPANLLSLGAIDFGIIVDAAIVIMENILRRREEDPESPLGEENARSAALQVARPIFFATLIIITAYLPLFAFQRVEKKLFSPMAYVVGYSLIGALLMALAIIPGLSLVTYQRPRKVFHNPVLGWISQRYEHAVHHLMHHPLHATIPAASAMILAVVLSITIGKEFLPYLDEGSIWLQVQLPPGLSLQKAASMADELRAATLEFPEVSTIVTQLGRNDDGTDPWTPSHIESFVGLKAYDTWPNNGDKADLIRRLGERFDKVPGLAVGFSDRTRLPHPSRLQRL